MYCHNLEAMGWNPSWVELGMRSTWNSVQVVLEPISHKYINRVSICHFISGILSIKISSRILHLLPCCCMHTLTSCFTHNATNEHAQSLMMLCHIMYSPTQGHNDTILRAIILAVKYYCPLTQLLNETCTINSILSIGLIK